MKIFIVGGTGLLGAAGAQELIRRGHSVRSIALPPIPEGANIPKEMEITLGNFMEMTDDEIKTQMRGFDALVFAAGIDERVEFAPPVYDVYKKYNIDPVERFIKLAKEVSIKKVIVLGSYFSYFAKIWPELELDKHHPYIKSRIDQERVALSHNSEKMQVMILELPYIFGAQKGRKPVWMLFVDMFLPMKTIFFPKGGTTMVTVNQVAQCIAGAVEKGKGGVAYPVGWYNMEWKELIAIVNKYMGTPDKKIVTIPTFLYALASKGIAKKYKKQNIEPGLNPVKFVKVMTSQTFIDKTIIEKELGVKPDDIEAAIGDSITYCMEIKNKNKKVVEMKAE